MQNRKREYKTSNAHSTLLKESHPTPEKKVVVKQEVPKLLNLVFWVGEGCCWYKKTKRFLNQASKLDCFE